jgi:hypothetical protein
MGRNELFKIRDLRQRTVRLAIPGAADSAPALELAQLYARRWEHELYFRELKRQVRKTDVLQSHTVDTAAQEIAALVLVSALIAAERARAAAGHVPSLLSAHVARTRPLQAVHEPISIRAVCVLAVQAIMLLSQRRAFPFGAFGPARHHRSFRSNRWPTAPTPRSSGRHGGFHSTPSARKAVQHLNTREVANTLAHFAER